MRNFYGAIRIVLAAGIFFSGGFVDPMEDTEIGKNSSVPSLTELALKVVMTRSSTLGKNGLNQKKALSDIIGRLYSDDLFLYAEYAGLLDLYDDIELVAQLIAQEMNLHQTIQKDGTIKFGILDDYIKIVNQIEKLPDKVRSAIWKLRNKM